MAVVCLGVLVFGLSLGSATVGLGIEVEGIEVEKADSLAGSRHQRSAEARSQYSSRGLLLAAVVRGDLTAIQELADAGANLEARDGEGRTPLALAAELGNGFAVRLLLKAGAQVGARTKTGEQPVHLASAAPAAAALAPLLAAGADVGARVVGEGPRQGWTPLIEAAAFDRSAALRQLLRAGADVNVRSERGRTALLFAAWHGYEEISFLLLHAGAATNAIDAVGIDPASAAGLAGNVSILRRIEFTHAVRARR